MWFPSRYRELGKPPKKQFYVLKDAVNALDEDVWLAGDEIKNRLAGDRPTNSVYIYNLDSDRFPQIMEKGFISQNDVDFDDSSGLGKYTEPMVRYVLSQLDEDCIIVRMQFARMRPGAKINPHYDSDKLLIASHRIHMPILTHDRIRFLVDGERVVMREGVLYELNNQLTHQVHNPDNASTRIHLIVDLLPSHFNNTELMNQRIEFDVRKYQVGVMNRRNPREINLPKVIATSVIRGANQSESHGGIYIVDLEDESVVQVVDWDDGTIRFDGRGLDRGLRGIAIYRDRVYVAAAFAIYEFDKEFNVINKIENQYLGHLHEMSIDGNSLYIASTGFDSVLRLKLTSGEFDKGWNFEKKERSIECNVFNPARTGAGGPIESNVFHINNVIANKGSLFISGRKMGNVIRMKDDRFEFFDRVPPGTHNVQPLGKGIVYNDSEADRVVYSHKYDYRYFDVPRYADSQLKNAQFSDGRLARQAFGRGLCYYKNGFIIAGSSPSTISVYDVKQGNILKSVNITKDIRNAVHGLEIWPF